MEIKQSAEYRKWFKKLRDHKAKAAIQARLDVCKLAGRPFGDIKPVGGPVSEMRFHTGAGYRVFCFNVCSTGSAVFFRSVG